MALTDNLNAYYKLDGNSNDSVNSNNGTDTDITYSAANGKIVQGAGFNGTTSKIMVADNAAFDITGDFSMSCWIKVAAQQTFRFISKNGTQGAYTVNYRDDRGARGYGLDVFVDESTNYSKYDVLWSPAQVLTNGTWYHLVVTWHITGTNTNTATFYVNGSSIGTANGTNVDALNSNNQSFQIGTNDEGTNSFLNGAIDEVGLWSRALSSTEVTQLYNGGAGLQYPFTAGPSNLKTYNTNAKSNCKTINTNLIANCKSLDTNV